MHHGNLSLCLSLSLSLSLSIWSSLPLYSISLFPSLNFLSFSSFPFCLMISFPNPFIGKLPKTSLLLCLANSSAHIFFWMLMNFTWKIQTFFFFGFLGLYWWHRYIEVPRLGVRLGVVAAGLHHNHSNARSKPCLWTAPQLTAPWIFNPPREAMDWTCILMDTSQIHFHWAMMGTPERQTLVTL